MRVLDRAFGFGPDARVFQLVFPDKAAGDAVVKVVIIVRDLVSNVDGLYFEQR